MRRSQGHYTGAWCERMWQYYVWSYYRQVEMVDAAIGRILDALENSPHAGNTLVAFTSDHGDAMGRHRLVHKLSLYDPAVRVPMIVAWPGQVAENHVDRTHLVSGFDLTPTLCDYAGTAAPPEMRGRSLRASSRARAGLAGVRGRPQFCHRPHAAERALQVHRLPGGQDRSALRHARRSGGDARISLRSRRLPGRWPSIGGCWPSGSRN